MPVGSVTRYLKFNADKIMRLAIRTAPVRGGNLKAHHDVERARSAGGRYEAGYRVINTAAYAYIVHEGTTEFGHPPGGKTIRKAGMSPTQPGRLAHLGPLPPWGSHSQPFHVAVSGQHANPWLSDAMAKVMLGL